MEATIRQLKSGFWAVYVGQTWIDAASATAEQAAEKARKMNLNVKAAPAATGNGQAAR